MLSRNALTVLAISLGLIPAVHAEAQSLSDCGDVYIEGGAQCTIVTPSVNCDVQCQPVHLQASCAAELSASCDGSCTANASVQCSGSCEAECSADCAVNPGSFECSAECQAECGADCSGRCSASGNKAECEASCRASCSGHCNASCEATPPSASCEAQCEASCSGSCEAKANAACQIDCQADGYAECQARLSGGCKAACTSEKGALFCDGQFIDTNNLDSCVAALKAVFDIDVQGYAEGEAKCGGGACEAEGKAGVSCSALPGAGQSSTWLAALSVLGSLGFAVRRRR